MSSPFLANKSIIEEGDLVFVWVSRSLVKPIRVSSDLILNTRYGVYPHSKFIGQRYGSQIANTKGKGFVYVLHPTPELWTISLPHRTQIVYTPDSSFISQKLGVLPGLRVIEAGTGSGSLTHTFSRACGTSGKVFSYEFHKQRFDQAQQEFLDHGLTNVHLTHRNVCSDGFDVDTEVLATAVFLDLPAPWEAVPHLNRVIGSQRTSICCFSPCIEQVDKTIRALHANGWSGIEMVEINAKKWESHKHMVRKLDDVLLRLKDIRKKNVEGIRKIQERRAKRLAGEPVEEHKKEPKEKTEQYNPFGKGQRIPEGDPRFEWKNVSRDEFELKSHTSFLTFAFKVGNASPETEGNDRKRVKIDDSQA